MVSIHLRQKIKQPSLLQRTYSTCLLSVVLLFVLCGTLFGHTRAFAQSTQLFWQEAQSLFRQGRKLAIRKRYKHALIKYVAAVNLLKQAEAKETNPNTKKRYHNTRITMLYVIGRTYHLDQQFRRAYAAYKRCLEANPSPKLKRIVRRFMKQILPKVTTLVSIESTPSKARLRITSKSGKVLVAETPFTGRLLPGTYTIALKIWGFKPLRETLLISGKKQEKYFLLQKMKTKTKPSKRFPSKLPLWVGVGGGIAAGIGVLFLAFGIASEQAGRSCQGKINDSNCQVKGSVVIANQIKDGATYKGIGITAILIGAGAGVAAFLLAVLPKKPTTPQQTTPSRQVTQLHFKQPVATDFTLLPD